MENKVLNGNLYIKMLESAAANLNKNRTVVNDLNVFPIPDGDTGDNMYMTINSGCVASFDDEEYSLDEVADKTAKGMLLGARGNSGVILSRIFSGIAKGLKGVKYADAKTLGTALEFGIKESYEAVSKPVEGTILTVYKDAVNYANQNISDDTTLDEFFNNFIKELNESLDRTPDLLDVLKEAGVVDSGGAGFLYIAEGMKYALEGKEIENKDNINSKTVDLSLFNENSVLEYGYCTEFLLQLHSSKTHITTFNINTITDFLNTVGDSVVAFKEGTIIKVHVHTMTPGKVLDFCQNYGEFLTLKIENMTIQHNEINTEKKFTPISHMPHKKYGIVCVAFGDGIVKTFQELGVDRIIDGGQCMNPSTSDFINTFNEINADNIIVFPNNSNIILTAQQARDIYDKSNIVIIPTKSIGEGYAAISMLDTSSDDIKSIVDDTMYNIENVKTGMVSKATKDTNINNIDITKDSYIGFDDDKIYTCNSDKNKALTDLSKNLNIGNYDIALIIRGCDTNDNDIKIIKEELEKTYKQTEIIIINGEQPIYDYILVLE